MVFLTAYVLSSSIDELIILISARKTDDSQDTFHTVHHKNVKFNFGQFLPLWDQLAGTHQDPVHFFSSKKRSVRSPESRHKALANKKGN